MCNLPGFHSVKQAHVDEVGTHMWYEHHYTLVMSVHLLVLHEFPQLQT